MGWKGSIPASWSVLVPRSRAAQTPEVSSLLRKEVKRFSQGHADLPKDMQKACGKAGNLRWVPASPAHSLFAAFKQIKIPSEGWTSALLGGQRAENPSLCQGHRLKEPF